MQLSFDIDGLLPENGRGATFAATGEINPAKTEIWLPEQDSNLRPFD
jgi:hypothetical protein